MNPFRLAAAVALSGLSLTPAWSAEHTVSQKNKEFATKSLQVKVGDSVDFRNDDTFAHNVFSLSDVKSFDLGSYPQGQSRKVTFEKAGKVEVECSIHPNMRLAIEVAP